MEKNFSYFLPPGEAYVSSIPKVVIETYLGSCIGVGLYDFSAHIGGVVHIILPTGSKEKESKYPTRYASTGIPYLIKEMIGIGSSKEHLKAYLVGGASIVQDNNINIGVRNIKKAKEILSKEGIPIIKEDTGGNFGRIFRLYIKDGTIETKPIGHRLHETEVLSTAEKDEKLTLKVLLHTIDQLKPIANTVHRVLKIIESDPFSVEEIKKEIYKDQALTANILKICNSPYYGMTGRVYNLSQAIVLLGLNNIKKIIISLYLKDILPSHMNLYSLRRGEFLEHALCCAFISELIAKEKQYPEPEVVFTAGLLHDIGKVILEQIAANKFHLIAKKVFQEKKSFLEAEEEILGYTHTQIGEIIAREWNLPEALQEAIAFHHIPKNAQNAPIVVSIVHIADIISRLIGIGCGVAGLTTPIDIQALNFLKLKKSEIDFLIDKVPEIIQEINIITNSL